VGIAPGQAWERRKSDVIDRNLSMGSRGFDSLPVEVNHQPEVSLAWGAATYLVKRRQQISKPRD